MLAAQGLGGPFATRLLSSLSRHIGEHRISRITTYDHTLGANGHEWSFRIMDRVRGQMTPVVVPTTLDLLQTVTGSSAHAALEDSFAHLVGAASTKDPVASVVGAARPAPGSPEALSLAKSFDAALRVENPGIHNAATTDCANCHLAEGAHRIGTSVYGFKVNNGSRFDPSVPHRDERTSVTNLHSFGYLKGEICISQGTANEATAAAQSLFRGGGGPRRPLTEHMRGGA